MGRSEAPPPTSPAVGEPRGLTGPTPGRSATLPLEADLRQVSQARDFTRRTLSSWALDHCAPIAELIVSELVTNALVHTRGTAILEVRAGDARVRVCVTDGHSGVPERRPGLDVEETSGRGLMLVEALATSWGVSPSGHGKTIWAELATG